MTKLRHRACIIFLLYAGTVTVLSAQTFTTLMTFDNTDGAVPFAMALSQGLDGNLYGTTADGGESGSGTAFKITLEGMLTTLYEFCSQPGCIDGNQPFAGPMLAGDGNFYGTTHEGGTSTNSLCGNVRCGTIYRITQAGEFTTVYSFCSQPNCVDGWHPHDVLVESADGSFYGTTKHGGIYNLGVVFKFSPAGGTPTALHNFDGSDGANPTDGLIQATDGNFYGTTSAGGDLNCKPPVGCGTVFKMTPGGQLATLYAFTGADGAVPFSGLIQAADGYLYGTTHLGGNLRCQPPNGCGTIFKITTRGQLTTLHSFVLTDGAAPMAGLIQATDGNFYGTTEFGGDKDLGGVSRGEGPDDEPEGTLFEMTPDGTLITLHRFQGDDGQQPVGGLLQDTNGTFYGTTTEGGDLHCNPPSGCGTVFSLSTGLGPFVSLLRGSGKVGQAGDILGQGFTGASKVSIAGSPATFRVKSDTALTTTVPAGATSGWVAVTTPSGVLTSNVRFRVLPQLLTFKPRSGPVGTVVKITGVSLTQTRQVGFGNEAPAKFTVNSDTEVTAAVPKNAKTGSVGIETLGGMAVSSQTFTVTP